MSNTPSTVHIVHCIDTEGPLHEPLAATFERVRQIYGIELEPTRENLSKLQNGKINLGGQEKRAAEIFSAEMLDYNNTWDKVDAMLRDLMSEKFRTKMLDSFGGGWVYNWHLLDMVGFESNFRRRAFGYHNVFDHYVEMIAETGSKQDGVHFHHHPVSFTREATHYATHYFSHTPIIFKIIARRIIERKWFPCANRPGYNVTRPDSHWFMEQFVPFDIASQATEEDYSHQADLAGGRLGDWRRAPLSWSPYHPDHDDYQVVGNCRRWIARCLNVGSRARLLTEADVEQAFQEAKQGKPVVMAFANHDYRDMRRDVDNVRGMLARVTKRYPDVPYRFSEARDAMRGALGLEQRDPVKLNLTLEENLLHIKAGAPTFGPQPFLALKTRSGQFFHDNLDFQKNFREWTYTFDEHTFPLDALETIGLGTCDATGNATVVLMDAQSGDTKSYNC